MFHVERFLRKVVITRIAIVILLMLSANCSPLKPRLTITDYIILPNGKKVLDHKQLNAFVFENSQRDVIFQSFLVKKFGLDSFSEKEFVVSHSGEKFKVLIYDNSELEKYFVVSNFNVSDINPAPLDPNTPKFIAISILSETNEDCLSENSLYYNVAINFLKELKDEYKSLQ